MIQFLQLRCLMNNTIEDMNIFLNLFTHHVLIIGAHYRTVFAPKDICVCEQNVYNWSITLIY